QESDMSYNANQNVPSGFTVFRAAGGTPNRLAEYRIAGTYGSKIHSGGPVSLSSGSLIVPASANSRILGVFQGCEYVDVNGDTQFRPYWPAPGAVKTGTVVKALVNKAEGELFSIMADGDLSYSDIGNYFALTALSGGNDATGRSSIKLDADSGASTTPNKTVKLVDIAGYEGSVQIAVVKFLRPEDNDAQVFAASS